MGITVSPLPQALGARIEGLDVAGGIDDDTARDLRAAWHDNLVLFFPGIQDDDDEHIALGSVFGQLAATSQDDDDYGDATRVLHRVTVYAG